MKKAISVRYNRELMAVFARYDKLTGGNLSRPKAVEKWLGYLASLPKDKETAALLHAASLKIYDEPVKPFSSPMKLTVEISQADWMYVTQLIQYGFGLSSAPQARFLLRVSGTVYIEHITHMSDESAGWLSEDDFAALSLDDKINEIYRVLKERYI